MSTIIKFSKLKEEGIVIEESSNFKDSAFMHIYQKAELLLWDIIERNKKQSKFDINRQQGQIDNVISFQGRRGTGKTSAMLSFQEALKKYDVNEKGSFLKKENRRENVSFTVLDYIDASMLEDRDNILQLVVANMFSELNKKKTDDYEERNQDYKRRELYQLFDEVYRDLLYLRDEKRTRSEITPLRELKNLSNSQTLGVRIRKLVDKYLEYMNSSESGRWCDGNHYLVIAIDDLDLCYSHSKQAESSHTTYEMLETIHRYLMIPGVIILLTYSYPELCIRCENYLVENYKNQKEDKKYIQGLATDYLQKVCPIYTRISMPSLKKRDYAENDKVKIFMGKDELKSNLPDFGGDNGSFPEEDCLFSVKKLALLLKASFANLYYDAAGKKRHFAEPSTLRELAQMYSFYRKIKEFDEQHEGKQNIILKELLDDFYFRFAVETLTREELKKIKYYAEFSIDRRGKEIIDDINRSLNMQKKEAVQRQSWLASDSREIVFSEINYNGIEEKVAYSYGELLYGLYVAGHKDVYSRELVCCMLEAYTIMLTAIYQRIKIEDCEVSRKSFQKIIGSSVAGSWANKLSPKYSKMKYGASDSLNENKIESKQTDLISVGAMQYSKFPVVWDFSLAYENKDFGNLSDAMVFKKQLHMLEILGMFFSNVYSKNAEKEEQSGFYVEFKPNNMAPKVTTSNEKPVFAIGFTDASFNVMNFVTNALRGEDYFKEIHGAIEDACEAYYNQLMRFRNAKVGNVHKKTSKASVKKFLDKHTLYKSHTKWYEETKGFAMPLYSLDMMYNVYKRQYQIQKNKAEVAEADKFWGTLESMYFGIGELLREEDQFYFSNSDSGKFYNSYISSPFISYIKKFKEKKNSEIAEKFKEHFEVMLRMVAVYSRPEKNK